jgi:hypothetical protein
MYKNNAFKGIKINLFHSLGLGLQIYEGHDDQLNRPGPMAV